MMPPVGAATDHSAPVDGRATPRPPDAHRSACDRVKICMTPPGGSHAAIPQRRVMSAANGELEQLRAERDALKAKIERVRGLRDQWVLASMPADAPLGWPSSAAAYADVVAWLDAALDAPGEAQEARK